MGPRSGERGNLHKLEAEANGFLASMGPRSGERGNSRLQHPATLKGNGFNGAAFG